MTIDDESVSWTEIPELNRELSFGEIIRSFRQCEALKLIDAARTLNMSRQKLCDLEKGRWFPSLEKALSISQALGIPPRIAIESLVNDQLKRADVPYRMAVTQSG